METDGVELKLTLPEGGQQAALEALGMDPLDVGIRQVFFFDTPELELDGAGVYVRARRIQDKPDDAVLKLRPVELDELPEEVLESKDFSTELDAVGDGFKRSATLKHEFDDGRVREVTSGEQPLRKLLTEEQRDLYADRAPDGVGLGDLSVLGPVFVLKLKLEPAGYQRELVGEMWIYPDDSRILELSARCTKAEAAAVATETRTFLTGLGIEISAVQETKTRKALDFFSKRLRAGRPSQRSRVAR
jgi:hypothetical protein